MWDVILEYGFAFLIYMYKSYLLFFNDWQSRLIIARCLTFVPPFRARAVFLGLIPPCLSMLVVLQSLCYGCRFWTVSHKVARRTLVVILLDISPVLQTDFPVFYFALFSRIENISIISWGDK